MSQPRHRLRRPGKASRTPLTQASALAAVLAAATPAAAEPDAPIIVGDTAEFTGDQHLGVTHVDTQGEPFAGPGPFAATVTVHSLTTTVAPSDGFGVDVRRDGLAATAPTLTLTTDASVHIEGAGERGVSVRSVGTDGAGSAIVIDNAADVALDTGLPNLTRAVLQGQEVLRDFHLNNVVTGQLALNALAGADTSPEASAALTHYICEFVGFKAPFSTDCIPLPVTSEEFTPLLSAFVYSQQSYYDFWNSPPSPVEVLSRDPLHSLDNRAALVAENFGVRAAGGDIFVLNTGTLTTRGASGIGILAQSVAVATHHVDAPHVGGDITVENHGAISTGAAGQGDGASAAAIFARSLGSNSFPGGDGGAVFVHGSGALSTNGAYGFGIYAASIGGNGTSNQGFGGDGGLVAVAYGGDITTTANYASGIRAVSIGGRGAEGKDADDTVGGDNEQANPGAAAGNGGDVWVTVEQDSLIATTGAYASGVVALTQGGEGGEGGAGNLVHDASWGGQGGDGGAANAANFGVITTAGDDAYGMLIQSLAGDGGRGGNDSGLFADHGGAGGAAGGGGSVYGANIGDIHTMGARSFGILAQSIGGRGGAGGDASSWFGAHPGRGGTAGTAACQTFGDCPNGGLVTVDNWGTIITEGFGAYAVLAQSIGGGGGQGGDGSGWLGIAGGEGGDAGHGDTVRVTNYGLIEAHGERSGAIVAQSIGGGGGHGGDANAGGPHAALAIGGHAGAGGAGLDVRVVNEGVIVITGERSNAILAQSIGGGGGVGGDASAFSASGVAAASISIGGSGGAGGAGDLVDVFNGGDIVTFGDFSNAILAQSIGGGGGVGGSSYAFSAAAGIDKFALATSVSIGGDGGEGGDGGSVLVVNEGAITTYDFNSIGILAQSIGGGGGAGGSSTAGAVTAMAGQGTTFTLAFAIGGEGGVGADAGADVVVDNYGSIFTLGDGSSAIVAQSIGGGGGNGGDASTMTAAISAGQSSSVELNVAIGGGAGDGGDGGVVHVTNTGTMVTLGWMSNGITAQSIGGGGGAGGYGDQSDLFGDFDIPGMPPALGGGNDTSSGSRGRARNQFAQLQQTAQNAPLTAGSHGRSGRGAGGGQSVSVDLSLSIGGNGGAGGGGDTVTVENSGSIWTGGVLSMGVFAQSVGGGGGAGGGGTGSADGDVGLGAGIGGEGAVAGDGGQVFVYNTGSITTLQAMSYGIFAQSVGGGGGLAGVGAGEDEAEFGVNLTLGMGGDGGDGGQGDLVHVEQTGDIVTLGYAAIGVFAQSVGGGGGVGGAAQQGTYASIGIGGSGGNANDGGAVEVFVDGDIATEGDFAHGVFAQSVGGGGGLAGGVDTRTYVHGVDAFGQLEIDTGMTLSVATLGIGGGGGAGGAGRDVTVISDGDISAFGEGAHGVFAQSIGGGGGAGGDGGSTFPLALGLAGSNGDGGAAGAVTIAHTGDIRAWGEDAAGIYAQSMDGQGAGRGGDITIILNGGDVQGGSGDAGVGVFVSGGASNLIENRGGHISAASSIAIAATDGDDTVINAGRVTGSVGLGDGVNAFDNVSGGLFESGEGVYLGAGGLLTNAGVVSPLAAGQVGTTTLVGAYRQQASGALAVDVDFVGGPSDLLLVQGPASLDGAVLPLYAHASLLRTGLFVPVLSADTLTDNGVSIDGADTLVLDFTSRILGNTLEIGVVDVDFVIDGLAPPEQALAEHFQSVWRNGEESGVDPVMDHLAALTDAEAYGALLDTLHPHSAFTQGAQPVALSQTLLSGMMSCAGGPGASNLRERACIWGRASQLIGDQDASTRGPEYRNRSRLLHGGAQAEIAPGWFAGFSLALGRSEFESEGYSSGDADILGVGAALKRQFGDLLLAGAVEYARVEADHLRQTGFPLIVDAASSSDTNILAVRLRAAHAMHFDEFYLRPALDLDAYEFNTDPFSETGAGALNLQVMESSQTLTSAGLSLDAGFLYVRAEGLVVHPYLVVGITALSEDSIDAEARFEGDALTVPSFVIESPIPDELTRIQLGFEALFRGGGVRIEYEERDGDSYRDYSFAAKVRYQF